MSIPALLTDYYKIGHIHQYPEGTTVVYSNFTPRTSRVNGQDYVVFFGLQYFIKEYLIKKWNEEFFQRPKQEVVDEYKRVVSKTLGENLAPTKHIEDLHDLGFLPITIKALPEGSKVPLQVPAFTIFNTKPKFFWLTNFIETLISNIVWTPTTSATTAHRYRVQFDKYAEETGANKDFIKWQAHDFSFRGMSSLESACTSGAAHLLSFTGTDTIPAITFLEKYYGANLEKELIGGSVPASEHSVMSIGSAIGGEFDLFKRFITEVYPEGIVSVVSDTWDYWNVITDYLPKLKNEIVNRNGKLVIRPDSGDPVRIIVGDIIPDYSNVDSIEEAEEYAHEDAVEHIRNNTAHGRVGDIFKYWTFSYRDKYYQAKVEICWNRHDKQYYYIDGSELVYCVEIELSPEQKGTIQCMWETFGGTINEKGYKELDQHIGLIYGDSITPERQVAILNGLKAKGFASSNVVLGVGSFTYQHVTRDTYGFAMKATYGVVDGIPYNIYKDPKTDNGMKKSAKGLLSVYKDQNGQFQLKQECTFEEEASGELVTVFSNGRLTKEYNLSDIRQRLNGHAL